MDDGIVILVLVLVLILGILVILGFLAIHLEAGCFL